jgi:hypothetical protein
MKPQKNLQEKILSRKGKGKKMSRAVNKDTLAVEVTKAVGPVGNFHRRKPERTTKSNRSYHCEAWNLEEENGF